MTARIVPKKVRLVCLLLLVTSSCAFPSKEAEELDQTPAEERMEANSRFALLDDVRLLANGLLQLGQSLKEFVHKTKSQINDIFHKLSIFDRSFYQLSMATSEIKEGEEELKKTTSFLKVNNEEIKNLSLEISSKVNSILQERSQLQSAVWGLEARLSGLSENQHSADQITDVSALKDVILAQERSITDLLKAVREQHDQLDYQKNRIKSLEDKLDLDAVQDTTEQKADSNPEAPKLFEYLTNNSTSTSFVNGEFWLGLKKIYSIARKNYLILHIQLEDWKEEKRSVDYQFSLEGPGSHYTVHLTHLSGDLPDAMTNHTGMKFSTKDRDNDNDKDNNCAHSYTGGWWFNACGETNLNGNYLWVRPRGRMERRRGLYWKSERGGSYSLKSTKISIRHGADVSSFH
ncbi:hypothetical protein AAFF_G00074210 [Aldrovandia affinis]|uniref:Fibrinogen C-terminal domain-containing protein n=1 Tax=Aldrovandia affinis TaxID=143900 RepID=A0AAD7RY71_9TELE|nr:hypothetical protein AAFF_G00074210 [Aldrovandia affinis]